MSSSWFLAAKHDDVVSLGRALQAQSFLLNSQDSLGYTALHHAAKEGSLEAIAMLIQGKADVNLQTKLGDSALIIAAQHNRKEVGEVLIMAGANLNIQNARGDSALMTAARYNSKDVVYPLISARANTNLRTTNGNNTALMIAAGWDYTDIVTALIIGGADLEIQNNEGKTAVKIAKATNFIRSAFLIECALAKRLKRPNDFIISSDIEPSPKKTTALVFPASRNWEVDFDELLLEDLIGNGGFGEVYKARLNGTPVAVKKVFSNFRASREEHPTPQTAWPWSIIERVTFGISCGMAFLHGKDPPILHQDLKSLNILIGEGYTAKVVDFGMTRLKSSRCLARGLGSYEWTAPEVYLFNTYGKEADVYSFSVICWELLSRACPYEGFDRAQAIDAVTSGSLCLDIPAWCPTQYEELIKSSWSHNSKKRPSFQDILKKYRWTFGR